MGRTQIVCGGKRVSEDERKRKAGGRGAAAGATPTRRFTRLENARGRPRSPVLRPGPRVRQLFWQVNDDAVGRLVGGEMCV